MIEEVFVETCWEEEAIVRARRDARLAELEVMGLRCRTEDLYRVPDWRRVFVVIAEPPEVEPIASLRQNDVERGDRNTHRQADPSTLRREQERHDRLHLRVAQTSSDNRPSTGSVGMGMLRSAIEYKLLEGNGFLMEAPTQNLKPTQRCAKCWELTPKTLSDRLHVCANPNCSYTEDRDVNSAQVCKIWAKGLGTSLSDAEPSSSTAKTRKAAGAMRQLGAMKRQKPAAL
jgi:hypothetical protein